MWGFVKKQVFILVLKILSSPVANGKFKFKTKSVGLMFYSATFITNKVITDSGF